MPTTLSSCRPLLLGTLTLVAALPLRAQPDELALAPAAGEFEAAELPPPAEPFLYPEITTTWLDRLHLREQGLTLKVGLVTIADYTAISQDAASVTQVGRQKDKAEARAARLMFYGALGEKRQASYLIAGEYKGFESDPDKLWVISDVSITFPLGGPETKLTVGKTKETFAFEMVGVAANLPQMERVLSPFFVSRNFGVRVNHVIGKDHRMTLSGGLFNDAWLSGDRLSDGGTTVTARLTRLLWDQREGKSYLHLGLAGRYVGADNHTLRYRGRPESNVTSNYVDTGNLAADHATHLGLEALWNEGPFSLLAEYNRAWVDSPANGNPSFSGWYVTGSWIVTGETRPYDRTGAVTRRVMPADKHGALELVARFSHVDLDDGVVQGGAFDKTYLGFNWWATRRSKLGFGWGRTWLDRTATRGVTDSFLTRLQWLY